MSDDLKRIKEKVLESGFQFAPTDKVNEDDLRDQIQVILDVIGHPKAWVSDYSMLGDFMTEHDGKSVLRNGLSISDVSEKLGVSELNESTYIVDLAKKLVLKKND